MRAVLQRVTRASVEVDASCVGEIERGWLILLGVAHEDSQDRCGMARGEGAESPRFRRRSGQDESERSRHQPAASWS